MPLLSSLIGEIEVRQRRPRRAGEPTYKRLAFVKAKSPKSDYKVVHTTHLGPSLPTAASTLFKVFPDARNRQEIQWTTAAELQAADVQDAFTYKQREQTFRHQEYGYLHCQDELLDANFLDSADYAPVAPLPSRPTIGAPDFSARQIFVQNEALEVNAVPRRYHREAANDDTDSELSDDSITNVVTIEPKGTKKSLRAIPIVPGPGSISQEDIYSSSGQHNRDEATSLRRSKRVHAISLPLRHSDSDEPVLWNRSRR